MNGYDPRTDQIILEPDASLYVRFHELAHQEQWKSPTRIWRFICALRCIRGVNYLATLWIEFDALRRARYAMRELGQWNEEASNEAGRMLRTYIWRKEEI